MQDPEFLFFEGQDSGFSLFETRDSGLNEGVGGGMPKITLGIAGIPEILGRDYRIEESYWGPSI